MNPTRPPHPGTPSGSSPVPGSSSVAKRVYDVAVLGPDLGGAAAAALIARRGLRVLLLPLSAAGVTRESEGFLFPAAHPMVPPLRQLSGATGALDELGLGQDLQRQAALTAGAFQLLGEKLRLSLPADPQRRRAELRRELPADEAGTAETGLDALERLGRPWDPFLLTPPPLPARGFFERRRLRKMIPAPPELPAGLVGEALAAVAPFSASLIGESAPEATAREAAALLRAPLRLWGGAAQIADLLRKKAQEAGADIIQEKATALRMERKGIVLTVGGNEVHTSAVVLACDGEVIAGLCEGGGRAERKLAEESHLPVARKVVLAHFVVRAEGLPLALEEAALLLGHPEGPLVISALPARRARGESPTERLLTVAKIANAGDADPPALLAAVRAALEPVLPFFDRHILVQQADLNPPVPHPIFAPREDGEPLGLRPISETHERVLFASSAVYPGFGLEGSFLAARACADQALLLSGRKQVAAT